MSTSTKSIELVTSQVKRIEKAKKGETILLMFPIMRDDIEELVIYVKEKLIISELSPIQKGDKDVFVREEFCLVPYSGDILYKSDKHQNTELIQWENSSEMTKEQSRFSLECIDVRIVKVQDIVQGSEIQKVNPNLLNYKMFIYWYNTQLKEQNINRTYEDNDYIFLIEIKDEKDEL